MISCFKENNDLYKNIIERYTNHIMDLEKELKIYKDFHDDIIEHEIITKKFLQYENTIQELLSENNSLRRRLIRN